MTEISKINLNLFKMLQISENNLYTLIYTCDLCNKHPNTISIFDSCNHHCCSSCVNNLFHSYLKNNNYQEEKRKIDSIMFICPFCNSKVYDIIYKK